jgi:flavin reductase (DIM6/NTAB) family NADH-FMN oxidoreductase RutF
MAKVQVAPHRPVHPTPAALITSMDEEGNANIITLGEAFNVSIEDPVILGIAIHNSDRRDSHAVISRTGEFVVNLPTAASLDKVRYCGRVHGNDVDKFQESGLTRLPAAVVKPPLIAECPINIECKLLSVQSVGDHDLFLGQAVAQHVNQEVLDENGEIIVDKLDGFANVLGQFRAYGPKVT